MTIQQTLSVLKPDITQRNLTGVVNAKIEAAGLRIIAQKRVKLSLEQAQAFYNVHKDRAFFHDLCEFMISGPVVAQILEGENAIALYRDLMGATNPVNAAEGTIRQAFAQSVEANSVHGSDAVETAVEEIRFFFNSLEIVG